MKNKKFLAIITAGFFSMSLIWPPTIHEHTDEPVPQEVEMGTVFPVPVPRNGTTKDIIPPSPKVASLGIFGQIPIGHFTGTANINIPLHTISYKELALPIGIYYNTMGNKPDIIPGNVGLGWGLQAGGMITRKVNGKLDTGGDVPNYYYRKIEDLRHLDDWYDVYKNYGGEINSFFDFDGHVAPDEFSYNINGQTGSFFLNYNDTIMVRSDQGEFFNVVMHKRKDLKYRLFPPGKPSQITASLQVGNYYFPPDIYGTFYYYLKDSIETNNWINGFTMIDSKGIKYTFGNPDAERENDNAIEFSRLGHDVISADPYLFDNRDISMEKKYLEATTWHLTSIESPKGYSIKLKYERDYYVTKFRFTDFAYYYWHKCSGGTGNFSFGMGYSKSACWRDAFRSVFINGSVLSQIEFPDGKAVFINSEATEQLDYGFDEFGLTNESYANSYNLPFKHLNQFFHYPDIAFANTENAGTLGAFENYRPHKVDDIYIYDSFNNLVRYINFNYTNNRSTRLKLLSLTVSGTDGGPASLKYGFEYNPEPLPPYLMNMTDYYGFYNGKKLFEGFNVIEGHLTKNPAYYETTKQPDFNYAKAEILTKIIYPTGGYSEFEYEPHDFGKVYHSYPSFSAFPVNRDTHITKDDAGGLRIKSVKNYGNDNKLIKSTEYVYKTETNVSSGVLAYGRPDYVEKQSFMANIINRPDIEGNNGGNSGGNNGVTWVVPPSQYRIDIPEIEPLYFDPEQYIPPDTGIQIPDELYEIDNETGQKNGFYTNYFYWGSSFPEMTRISTSPAHPMSSVRGSHVTYSEVKVIEGDNNGINGYTVYKYQNYDNGFGDQSLKGYLWNIYMWTGNNINYSVSYLDDFEGISMKQERGLPFSIETFDNKGKPVKKTNFLYNSNFDRFKENVRYIKKFDHILALSGADSYMILAGVHYTYHPYLKEKQETLYFGSDNVQINTKYTYNEKYRLLKTTEVTDSRGDVLNNEIFYPFEKSENVYKTMTDRYMVAYPTGSISKRNTDIIAQSETKYAQGLNLGNANLILPYQEYFSVRGNPSELISTYNKYDKIGNPLSITDNKSGDKVCYLWSYNGSYPVAKVIGFNYDEVKRKIQGGEDAINALWSNMNPEQSQIETIGEALSEAGALVSTYTYKPSVGMMTETDFRGNTTYYEYDGLGRLIEVKAGKKGESKKESIESYEYNYSYHSHPHAKIISYSVSELTVFIIYVGCSESITSAMISFDDNYGTTGSKSLICDGLAWINVPYPNFFDDKYKITVTLHDNNGNVYEDSVFVYFEPF